MENEPLLLSTTLGGPALRPDDVRRTLVVGLNMIFVFSAWMEISVKFPVTVAAGVVWRQQAMVSRT